MPEDVTVTGTVIDAGGVACVIGTDCDLITLMHGHGSPGWSFTAADLLALVIPLLSSAAADSLDWATASLVQAEED